MRVVFVRDSIEFKSDKADKLIKNSPKFKLKGTVQCNIYGKTPSLLLLAYYISHRAYERITSLFKF